MSKHPALVAMSMIDDGEIGSSDQDALHKLRALLEQLAKLPYHGEDGPATEPGHEPEVGTNA